MPVLQELLLVQQQLKNPELVKEAVEKFGDKIAVGC